MSFSMGLPPVFLIFAIASRFYFNTGLFFVHSCKLLSTRSASGFRLHKKKKEDRSDRSVLRCILSFYLHFIVRNYCAPPTIPSSIPKTVSIRLPLSAESSSHAIPPNVKSVRRKARKLYPRCPALKIPTNETDRSMIVPIAPMIAN